MTSGIFVGLSTIDLIHSVDEFPPANTKAVARSQEVFVGGPATNAAITFSLLGGKATVVTGVGRHPAAGLVKDELRKYSIDLVDLAVPQSELFPAISSVLGKSTRSAQYCLSECNTHRYPRYSSLIIPCCERHRYCWLTGT